MQPQPERNPSRPSPAESAESLLATLDLSTHSECEELSSAYNRYFVERCAQSNQATNESQVVDILTLHGFADKQLQHARTLKLNAHVEFVGRMFSEPRSVVLKDEPFSTHCLFELRTRDGESALLSDYRIIPVARGAATMHLSLHELRPGVLGFELRHLLSPTAYSGEIERIMRLIEQGAPERELEKRSFLYCAFRQTLATRYGVAAPWSKELRWITCNGTPENPQFILSLSPLQEFAISPYFRPESCRLLIDSRLLGQP